MKRGRICRPAPPAHAESRFGHPAVPVALPRLCPGRPPAAGSGAAELLETGRAQPGEVVAGVIARTGQRRCRDHQEALAIGGALVLLELVGRHEPVDGVVLGRRLQILADGQEVDVGGTHVVHHLLHFHRALAQPDHDPRLGEHARIQLLHPLQQAQRMEVARTGAHLGIEAGHRLEIVVEHVGARLDHLFQHLGTAFQEVGGQDLDRGVGRAMAHGADRLGKMLGAAILEIVTVDRGDDDMLQPERLHRMGDAARLEHIKRIGPAGRDVAEGTAAGADLAHDHHRGVALAPAFADIRAARLFADGDQLVRFQDLAGVLVALRGRRLDPDPVRLLRLRMIGTMRLLGVTLAGKFQVAHRGHPFRSWVPLT
ncbi:hypothetical protein SDC9_39024 [bioreactor metagenome]|uniref:Uncharacterized protein n=1 Tax=bioreactor metagenome TaxID=1076179 RepID=A0A644VNY4_9ZZZZ